MNMEKFLIKIVLFVKFIFRFILLSKNRKKTFTDVLIKLGTYLLGIGFVGMFIDIKYSIIGSIFAIIFGSAIIYLALLLINDEDD